MHANKYQIGPPKMIELMRHDRRYRAVYFFYYILYLNWYIHAVRCSAALCVFLNYKQTVTKHQKEKAAHCAHEVFY